VVHTFFTLLGIGGGGGGGSAGHMRRGRHGNVGEEAVHVYFYDGRANLFLGGGGKERRLRYSQGNNSKRGR